MPERRCFEPVGRNSGTPRIAPDGVAPPCGAIRGLRRYCALRYWQANLIKHLRNRLDTVHGLVFGIPAEMTDFPACPDLYITASALAWECSLNRSGGF